MTNLLIEAQSKYAQLGEDLEIAQKDTLDLIDESTAALEANIQQVDEINRKVRANLDKDKAESDAGDYRQQYDTLTTEINTVRQQKTDLLTNADLPLPGLSVENGEFLYNGQRWDNMSGADQLKVAAAIVRKLKPNCGFILLDKLEQMDMDSLQEFGAWLEQEGLQAEALLPEFRYGNYYDAESFNIKLQSVFVANEDRTKLLKVVGNIKEEAVRQVGDDGVSQSIVAKTGVATVEDVKVPNPVLLAPYRTFVEVEQPESSFIFRMKDGPSAALFEADGRAWRNDAIANVSNYLAEELNELIKAGHIVVIA
ncbi:hypothetical protein FHR92_003546 [Fontibacillus solani]|uniref:Uncharacterized protein n=1 Tax=Fontibacillus solani TaxID=1572857 RepID=A0A7W3XSZ1_9BACL|nr:hypothetical protein [Fontibacillus solani]MBA9087066.1 hypothetical protein [Fontibacillus solani]